MGFFFRKSFRLGPAHVNVSKSDLGISAGTKGATIGTGTRGNYVAGGLKGLYFRKYLGSAGGNSSSEDSELSTAAVMVTWLVILACGVIMGSALWFVTALLLRT